MKAQLQKREIKFRAWIVESWDDDDIPKYVMTYDLAFEEYEPINDLLNSVEHLMQFTGLKDKKGKEIYEGDILKWELIFKSDFKNKPDTKSTSFYKIEYRNSGILNISGFYFIDIKTGKELHTGGKGLEVIGNIYESPELLK
jgi:uncharacterized phage protein (TIGR01671 family)